MAGSIEYKDKDFPPALVELLKEMDHSSDGSVSAEELQNFTDSIKAAKEGAFMYKHLPASINAVFKTWDTDDSGTVELKELVAASKATKKLKEDNARIKKILIAAGVAVVFLSLATFAMSVAAVEVTKDFRPAEKEAESTTSASRRLMQTVDSYFGWNQHHSTSAPPREPRRLQAGGVAGKGRQPSDQPKEAAAGGLGSYDDEGNPLNIGTVTTGKEVSGENLGEVLTQMTVEEARSLKKLSLSLAGGKIEFRPGAPVRLSADELLLPAEDGSGMNVRVKNGTMTVEFPTGAKEKIVADPAKLEELRDRPAGMPGMNPSVDVVDSMPVAMFDEESVPLPIGNTPGYSVHDFAQLMPDVGVTIVEYRSFCQQLLDDSLLEYLCPNKAGVLEAFFADADCNADGYLSKKESEDVGLCHGSIPPAADSLAQEKNDRRAAHIAVRRRLAGQPGEAPKDGLNATGEEMERLMPALKGKVTKEAVQKKMCESGAGSSRCEADPLQFGRLMDKADADGDGMFSESEFDDLMPLVRSNPERQADDSKRDSAPQGIDKAGALLPPGAKNMQLNGGGGSGSPELAGNDRARMQMMGAYDRNHDGAVDANEYKTLNTDPDAQAFGKMDRSMGHEDGIIDADEYAAFMSESVMESAGVSSFMFCLRDMDGNGRLSMDEATAEVGAAVNEANTRRRLRVLTQHIDNHRRVRRQRRLLAKKWAGRRLSHDEYTTQVRQLAEAGTLKSHVLAAHRSVRMGLQVIRTRRQRRRLQENATAPNRPSKADWMTEAQSDMTGGEQQQFQELMTGLVDMAPDTFEGAPWDQQGDGSNGEAPPEFDMDHDMASCYEPLQDIEVLESVFGKVSEGHRDDDVVTMMVDMGVDPSLPDSPFLSCKREMADDPAAEPVLEGGDALDCVVKMTGCDHEEANEKVAKFKKSRAARGLVEAAPGAGDAQTPAVMDDDVKLSPDDLLEIMDPMGSRKKLSECREAREMYANGTIGWTVVCDVLKEQAELPENADPVRRSRRLQAQQGGKEPKFGMDAAMSPPRNQVQKGNGNFKFAPPENEEVSTEEFFQDMLLDTEKAPACLKLPADEQMLPIDPATRRILTSNIGGLTATNTEFANLMSDVRGPGCYKECEAFMLTCTKADGSPCTLQEDHDLHALDCPCMKVKKDCHKQIGAMFLAKAGPAAPTATGGPTPNRRLRNRRLKSLIVQHRIRQLRHRKLLAADRDTQKDVAMRLRRLRRRLRMIKGRRLQTGDTVQNSGVPDSFWPADNEKDPSEMTAAEFAAAGGTETDMGPDQMPEAWGLNGPDAPLSNFDEDLSNVPVQGQFSKSVNFNPASDSLPNPRIRNTFEDEAPPPMAAACVPCPPMEIIATGVLANMESNTQFRRMAALDAFGEGNIRGANFTGDQRRDLVGAMTDCIPQEVIAGIIDEVTVARMPVDLQDCLNLRDAGAVTDVLSVAEYQQKNPMEEIIEKGSMGPSGSSAPQSETASEAAPMAVNSEKLERYVRNCKEDSDLPCDPAMVAGAETAVTMMRTMSPGEAEMELSPDDLREMMSGSDSFDSFGPDGSDRIAPQQFICGQCLMKGMPVAAAREEYRMRSSSPQQGMTRTEYSAPGLAETLQMVDGNAHGPVEMRDATARRSERKAGLMGESMAKQVVMGMIDLIKSTAEEMAAASTGGPVEQESIRMNLFAAAKAIVPTSVDAMGVALGGFVPFSREELREGHMALGAALVMMARKAGDPAADWAVSADGSVNSEYVVPDVNPDGAPNGGRGAMLDIQLAMPIVSSLISQGRVLDDADKETVGRAFASLTKYAKERMRKEDSVCPHQLVELENMDEPREPREGKEGEREAPKVSGGMQMDLGEGSGDSFAIPGAQADADGCIPMDAIYNPPSTLMAGSGSTGEKGNQQALQKRRRQLQQELGRRLMQGPLNAVEVPLGADMTGGLGGKNRQMTGVRNGVEVTELAEDEMRLLLHGVMPWQGSADDIVAGMEELANEQREAMETKLIQGRAAVDAAMGAGGVNGTQAGELRDLIDFSIRQMSGTCTAEEGCSQGGADFAYEVTEEVGFAIANYMSGSDGVMDLGVPAEFDCDSLERSETLVMQNEKADITASNQWAMQPLDFALLCRKARRRQDMKQKLSIVMDCFNTRSAVQAGRQAMSQDTNGAGKATEAFPAALEGMCMSAKGVRTALQERLSSNALVPEEREALRKSITVVDTTFKKEGYESTIAQATQPKVEKLRLWLAEAANSNLALRLREVLQSLSEQVPSDLAGAADARCPMQVAGTKAPERDPLSIDYDELVDEQCHARECADGLASVEVTDNLIRCFLWEMPEDLRQFHDDLEMVRTGEKSMREVVEMVAPALEKTAAAKPPPPSQQGGVPNAVTLQQQATMNPEMKMERMKSKLGSRRMRVRRRLAIAQRECVTVNGKEYCTGGMRHDELRRLQSGDLLDDAASSQLELETSQLARAGKPARRQRRRLLHKKTARKALRKASKKHSARRMRARVSHRMAQR